MLIFIFCTELRQKKFLNLLKNSIQKQCLWHLRVYLKMSVALDQSLEEELEEILSGQVGFLGGNMNMCSCGLFCSILVPR